MKSPNKKSATPSRPVSLAGVLAIITGVGLMLVREPLSTVVGGRSSFSSTVFLCVAIFLMLWGVSDVRRVIPQGWRRRRLPRFRGQRRALPRSGIVYLGIMTVLFVGSLLGRSNMLMLVFSMMAGPFILNGWITYSMLRRTRVDRRVPRRVMAGETFSVEITVHNRKRLMSSWLMAVCDRIGNQMENVTARVLFSRINARRSRTAYYQLRLMHRGRYFFGPVELSTQFPLGLVERGTVFQVDDTVLVHPRIGQLTARWEREFLPSAELLRQQRTRAGVFDDDFHRIREFRPGDNPRAIHWRTSARHNELMLREFHENRDQNLAVFLELYVPERPSEDDLARVEVAASLCATICVEHMRQSRESRLLLAACGKTASRWNGTSGAAGTEMLLDILAEIEAGPTLEMSQMFYEHLPGMSSNTRVLFITTRRDVNGALPDVHAAEFDDDSAGRLQVIEADPLMLAPYFVLE